MVETTLIWTVHTKQAKSGTSKEMNTGGLETPPHKPARSPNRAKRGARGHRKREGPSVTHKDRSRPSG